MSPRRLPDRLRFVRGDDAGVTLIELVVSMTLMTLVGAMSLTFFVGSSRSTERTTADSQNVAQARFALSTVIDLLRLADSPTSPGGTDRFVSVSATGVTFYSNDNGNRSGTGPRTAPEKVLLDLTGNRLVEKDYAPTTPGGATSTYPSTATATRILVTALATGSAFAYTDDQANPTTSPASVAAVTVTLVVPAVPGGESQTLVSTAAITGALQ